VTESFIQDGFCSRYVEELEGDWVLLEFVTVGKIFVCKELHYVKQVIFEYAFMMDNALSMNELEQSGLHSV